LIVLTKIRFFLFLGRFIGGGGERECGERVEWGWGKEGYDEEGIGRLLLREWIIVCIFASGKRAAAGMPRCPIGQSITLKNREA